MTVVVDALATARLTRLALDDLVTEPLRARIVEWAGRSVHDTTGMHAAHPRVLDLLNCPWCISVWIGAGVVAARRLAPDVWDPVARLLAYSAVAGEVAARTPVER